MVGRPLGLQTRVGRRMATLFVLSALVPIVVLAVLGYRQVRDQLLSDSRLRTAQHAKSLGMNLLDQVNRGLPRLSAGPVSPGLPEALTPHQRGALDSGRTVLVLSLSEPARVFLAGPGPRGTRWAELPAESLVAMARGYAGVADDARICVRDTASGHTIYCEPATGVPELAVSWDLFLSYAFDASPWRVEVARPLSVVLAPILAFRKTFFATTIALLAAVVALATFQVRRSLEPLEALHEATARIAKRDFSRDVKVTSRDEFEGLADAFNSMAKDLDGQFRSNAELITRLDELSYGALAALARTIDASSPWTAGHSERVTALALRMAAHLGLNQADCDTLRRGGLLHDIGKIGLPPEILDKPGRLTSDELAKVRQHPALGARILSPIAAFKEAIPIVLHHHERYDGLGYPEMRQGEEIPRLARLLAVADVYDALVSDRPYRNGYSHEFALEHIRAAKGTQFDPAMVDLFMTVISMPSGDPSPAVVVA